MSLLCKIGIHYWGFVEKMSVRDIDYQVRLIYGKKINKNNTPLKYEPTFINNGSKIRISKKCLKCPKHIDKIKSTVDILQLKHFLNLSESQRDLIRRYEI